MAHVFAFEDLRGQPLAEVRKIIGSKAANLAEMANELGLPVPPAFAVSTAACREYLAHGWPAGLEDEIRAHMARVEEALGAASAVGDDRLQKQAQGYVVPDSFTHGTSAQRSKWFRLGLQTGDFKRAKDLFELPEAQL